MNPIQLSPVPPAVLFWNLNLRKVNLPVAVGKCCFNLFSLQRSSEASQEGSECRQSLAWRRHVSPWLCTRGGTLRKHFTILLPQRGTLFLSVLAVSVGKVTFLSTSVEVMRKKEPWQKGRKRQDSFLFPSKSGFYILAFNFI